MKRHNDYEGHADQKDNELPCPTPYHQKTAGNRGPARMRRSWNRVRRSRAAALGNSTVAPRKLTVRLPRVPAIPLLGVYGKGRGSKRHLRTHVHGAHRGCMDKQHVVCPRDGVFLSLEEEGGSDMCYDIDGFRGHCAK